MKSVSGSAERGTSITMALCQINPTVGDLSGNKKKILDFYKRAVRKYHPDILIYPENALTGYPPEDLVLRKSFLRETKKQIEILAGHFKETSAIIGFNHESDKKTYNSAAFIKDARINSIYSKKILPNYGVFDDMRYFSPGKNSGLVSLKGVSLGISICEDIWETEAGASPVILQSRRGAKILINLSASPYDAGKFHTRRKLLEKRVRQCGRPIVYVNLVGGQDELVFDGRSFVLDGKGRLAVLAKSFEEDIKVIRFESYGHDSYFVPVGGKCEAIPEGPEEIYKALTLGTRDYADKNGFNKVLIGLSGGIDSALTASIAVNALGRGRVIAVTMPSRYSSNATLSDAEKTAKNLGIRLLKIPIESLFSAYLNTLSPFFRKMKPNSAEENLQSRIRGALLMALSNKFGHLVLTTGNKSEVSVGYCTLYGDTAGGFAVLKDVPKTMVYSLAAYANRKAGKAIIPQSTIKREPTAELKANQRDQDNLPPYEILDPIIKGYVEEDLSHDELLRRGIKKGILEKVLRLIDASEYKRRQSPTGIKITSKSFGRDRRMPITNSFKEF